MNKKSLHRRILDAVLESRDPHEVERELAEHPGMMDEYRRLQATWRALRALPARKPPPRSRERAHRSVIRALPARSARSRRHPRWGKAAAAAVFLFLGGVAQGRWLNLGAASIPTAVTPALIEGDEEPRYVLLIRGSPPAGDAETEVGAMTEWARSLWSQERLLWAERLLTETAIGRVEQAEGDIRGLFVIRARNREEAVRLARDSPHLACGGSVEVLATMSAADR